MSFESKITALLTALTPRQLGAMTPTDRQLLSDQLVRVYRLIEGDRIVAEAQQDAQEEAAEIEAKGGVLALLARGDRAL